MEIINNFTDEMINHLKAHPELLSQIQGRDIMQNFVVISPNERLVSFREVMENLRKKKQKILDDPDIANFTRDITRRDIKIIENFIGYMGDAQQKGLNVPKLRDDAVKYSEFLLKAFAVLIEDYKKDIEKYPTLTNELQVKIDTTHHVLLEFSILLEIKFPTSTAYLRKIKERYINKIF